MFTWIGIITVGVVMYAYAIQLCLIEVRKFFKNNQVKK